MADREFDLGYGYTLKPPKDTMIIGLTSGIFDFVHSGHVAAFEYMKKHCDYLKVAVQVDPSLYRPGKNKPIETILERTIKLKACRYVDEVIPYETTEDELFIYSTVYYDVRFIGGDHSVTGIFNGNEIRKSTHHFNPREHSSSSSSLRDRVIKRYQDAVKEDEAAMSISPVPPRGWIAMPKLLHDLPDDVAPYEQSEFKSKMKREAQSNEVTKGCCNGGKDGKASSKTKKE